MKIRGFKLLGLAVFNLKEISKFRRDIFKKILALEGDLAWMKMENLILTSEKEDLRITGEIVSKVAIVQLEFIYNLKEQGYIHE